MARKPQQILRVLALCAATVGCADLDDMPVSSLLVVSEEYCAPYGRTTGRYKITIEVGSDGPGRAGGSASMRLSEAALLENEGATLDLVCDPPATGPDEPYVVPARPTTVVVPLAISLPSTAPVVAECYLTTYSATPRRDERCIPWSLGARIYSPVIGDFQIDIVELESDGE